MELVEKGDFFNLIMNNDHMSEAMCKHFFDQIIDAVFYMHKNNVAHRDLKPQNCLLDQNYNIKLADFGFTCPLGGTTEQGFSTTRLGTPQYMAPELWSDEGYQAFQADLFACGVILFLMRAKNIPFYEARAEDPCYMFFYKEDEIGKFWGMHEGNYEPGHFSNEFKELVSLLLLADPAKRINHEQIMAHPWMQTKSHAKDEIKEYFDQ